MLTNNRVLILINLITMKKYLVLSVLSVVLLASCSSIKVVTDIDPTVDFTKYKTYEYYGWAEESGKLLNQLEKTRIEKAFGLELSKRDLNYVKEDGELIITLHIVTEKKTQKTATTDNFGGYGGGYGYGGYYGYGPGWGYGGGHSSTTINEYDYVVGTLIISFYDKKEESLIWESVGQKTLSESGKNRDEKVAKSAMAMMRDFPIKPIKK